MPSSSAVSVAPGADWAVVGEGRSETRREGWWAFLWMLLVPPEGHRTRPTPAGYVLIAVAVGLLSAAYASSSNNILFIALSLVMATLILSGVLSWLNYRRASWRLLLPAHFRAEEPTPVVVDVWNGKRLLPLYSVWFRIRPEDATQGERLYLEERLNPGEQTRLEWLFTPAKRGVDRIRLSGMESQYPFGFLAKQVGAELSREIVVSPRRVDYEFKRPLGKRGLRQGETVRRPGAGAELLNLRAYQPGDPQRLVHWKASARLRQLVVRQLAEDNRDGYTVFVETPATIWQDSAQFETLCSFATSLAEDLFREGRLVAVALNDEPLRVVQRLHDLHLFFEALGRAAPVPGYRPAEGNFGANLITFKPGSKQRVHACLGGSIAGTA